MQYDDYAFSFNSYKNYYFTDNEVVVNDLCEVKKDFRNRVFAVGESVGYDFYVTNYPNQFVDIKKKYKSELE